MVRNRTYRVKAASKKLTRLEDLGKDEQTTESDTFTAANEHITQQQSPGSRSTITVVRKRRLTSAQRRNRAKRKRWIFIGVPPLIKRGIRLAMHRAIVRHITDIDIAGIMRVQLIRKLYLVIGFRSREFRNEALVTLKAQAFNFENAPMQVAIRAYEDIKDLPHYVWRITGAVISDLNDVRKAVKTLCEENYPFFCSTFEVRRKDHLKSCTDECFVRFDRAPPYTGMRVINVGEYQATLNENLLDLCSLCNRMGHSVFYCQIKSNRLSNPTLKQSIMAWKWGDDTQEDIRM
ncbi:hypothetical protein BZA77DRAFT_352158 [Pyronema omphalodes]|nr:hypothetical protein BZA77DRAFT_359350 [Pyronema omphalodes]KAI5817970.1 hypothetical protein BZA77DRAFT_352158 [Pyronema omphalodes]